MKRVTADSNILISAFLRGGKPLELLALARAGHFELAVSDAILDETARVLKTKFRVPDEDVRDFGRELLGFARHVTPTMMISMRSLVTTLLVVWLCCASSALSAQPVTFHVVQDSSAGTISVLRGGSRDVVLVQNAQERIRPFLHPIMSPDGKGMLTGYRPSHHPHQTGVYWGLKATNGRDFFMTCCVPGEERYHRRVSASVLQESGARVSWRTVYNLLDEHGQTILVETKTWSIQEQDGKYLLDLEWRGDAKRALTVERFYVGGLFIRMPWHKGIAGEVINAAGQRNNQAEQQRAIWTDVGMAIAGRDDWGHIAILDHPDNTGFPIAWRVDSELGVGPSRQILQNWRLTEGESEVTRYRLIVYTGPLDPTVLHRAWTAYAGGSR